MQFDRKMLSALFTSFCNLIHHISPVAASLTLSFVFVPDIFVFFYRKDWQGFLNSPDHLCTWYYILLKPDLFPEALALGDILDMPVLS